MPHEEEHGLVVRKFVDFSERCYVPQPTEYSRLMQITSRKRTDIYLPQMEMMIPEKPGFSPVTGT